MTTGWAIFAVGIGFLISLIGFDMSIRRIAAALEKIANKKEPK